MSGLERAFALGATREEGEMKQGICPDVRCCAALLLLWLGLVGSVGADPHTRMMRATFKIAGDSRKTAGSEEAAAAFVVRLPGDAPSTGPMRLAAVTAAHFFDNVKSDHVHIVMRRSDDGRHEQARHRVAIRKRGKALWVRHPDGEVDAAALVVDWPAEFDVAPLVIDQLATTDALRAAFRPGLPVFAPGYPFSIEGSPAGYPILRHGILASYPPPGRDDPPTFLVDMAMFQGYSGSPVYVARPATAKTAAGDPQPLVLGMITRQHELTSDFKGPFETRKVRYLLDLAVVLRAPALRDLIARLEKL